MSDIKYIIKGTLKGSNNVDNDTEYPNPKELAYEIDNIKTLFTEKDPMDELAQYIDEDECLYGIITSIWVDVKIFGKELFSITEVIATRELTDKEKEELIDYLTGQFSDGYGEGLEQHSYNTYKDTGTADEFDETTQEFYQEEYEYTVDCYLHLWQSKEFKLEFIDPDAPVIVEYIKPKCKLIGEDGNVFNLMGLARRALTKAGQADKAKEMCSKAMGSGSYSEALIIIMDYVEVE